MICFALAEKLHRPVHEVERWPIEELRDWCAYFKVKADAESRR